MSTTNALNTGLFNLFSHGTALTNLLGGTFIYYQMAPIGTIYPYVVWSYQGGGPLNYTASDMRDLLVFARGYATSPALAGSIDQELTKLLHHGSVSVSGFNNYWTARETDYSTVETTKAGQLVYTAGGIYRVRMDD